MKVSDESIIVKLSHMGILVYRVTKLSKKPAMMKIGTRPTAIFTPCLAPLTNETALEYVPGNRKLLPSVSPAQPAITMADISSVPWIQITKTDSKSNPFV